MHIQWWQSIRGRLGLGSALMALLTTTLLAFTAIAAINYYYSIDQCNTLSQLATEKALYVDQYFVQNPRQISFSDHMLFNVAQLVLKPSPNDEQQYWMVVFNANEVPIYPTLSPKRPSAFATPSSSPSSAMVSDSPFPLSPDNELARSTSPVNNTLTYNLILQLVNASIQAGDAEKFQKALDDALLSSQHISTDTLFGRDNLLVNAQPFSVRPIFAHMKVVGALLVTPRSNVIPSFVVTIEIAVFIASSIIAILAVFAALFFSRPITIPLAKLTTATRQVAGGDYDAQVSTSAPGELGELARNFNDMAAQLKQDMESLRRQEVWRRELIMNITHDLATPLTAIAGLGEALVDGVNHSHEDYEATGRVIVRETLRLHRLVRDLHVMTKLEAKAVQPRKKSIRLAGLVDEALAVLASEFERAGVEPVNAIGYDLTPLQADADLLTRVFANLCNNALRHTPVGGYVIIEAVEHGNWLIVSVTDTGEGIPVEALSRVFERFYRADSSRQSSTGGSGLGLAIVSAIIEAHSGTAWVENVPGAGARISFSLPIYANEKIYASRAFNSSIANKYNYFPEKGKTQLKSGKIV